MYRHSPIIRLWPHHDKARPNRTALRKKMTAPRERLGAAKVRRGNYLTTSSHVTKIANPFVIALKVSLDGSQHNQSTRKSIPPGGVADCRYSGESRPNEIYAPIHRRVNCRV